MSTKYNSNYDETIPFSDENFIIDLAASTELTVTVPGEKKDMYKAVFSWGNDANVFVANNFSAEEPGTGTTSASRSMLNPDSRYVIGGDVLSFISAGAAVASVSFYLLSQ